VENLENWKFKDGSILSVNTAHADCTEIFQSVCDELGEYYQGHGFKYSRSGPHLTKKNGDIKLKLSFSSSRSNTPGQSVALEIIPSYESVSLAKHLSQHQKTNGYLFGHTVVFQKYEYCEKDCDVIVRYPFKTEIKRSDPNYKNLVKYSNNINVYGLTEENFVRLVNYINQFVVSVINVLQDEAQLYKFLKELPEFLVRSIFIEKRVNSKLPEYLQFKYPELYKEVLNELSA
tara:strand:+ start:81 stop:776 length:696 start_codon:yes stop_codon:yes gene_type:complete